jgi:hypothetical protein
MSGWETAIHHAMAVLVMTWLTPSERLMLRVTCREMLETWCRAVTGLCLTRINRSPMIQLTSLSRLTTLVVAPSHIKEIARHAPSHVTAFIIMSPSSNDSFTHRHIGFLEPRHTLRVLDLGNATHGDGRGIVLRIAGAMPHWPRLASLYFGSQDMTPQAALGLALALDHHPRRLEGFSLGTRVTLRAVDGINRLLQHTTLSSLVEYRGYVVDMSLPPVGSLQTLDLHGPPAAIVAPRLQRMRVINPLSFDDMIRFLIQIPVACPALVSLELPSTQILVGWLGAFLSILGTSRVERLTLGAILRSPMAAGPVFGINTQLRHLVIGVVADDVNMDELSRGLAVATHAIRHSSSWC